MIAMLAKLYIENIAVIEKAEIDFHAGFNVLTGETGAGKSIVIDSIGAVLGERASRELVRSGASSAFVSAVFRSPGEQAAARLAELGYEPEEDGSVMIQRGIGAESKSFCRINGRPATVSMLKEIGRLLVNIHGQHESYGLLSPDLHVGYVDSMGLPKELSDRYFAAYSEMRRLEKQLSELNMDEAEKTRKIDLLTYQIGELEDANLRAGEREELERRRTVIRNSVKIAEALARARDALDGDEESAGAVSEVSAAADALEEAGRYAPDVQSLAARVRGLAYDLEDCNEEMRGFTSLLEYDPSELEEIETRLDTLYRLSLKYGGTEETMLACLEKNRAELESIRLSGEASARLSQEYRKARELAEGLADEISARRGKLGALLSEKVKRELSFLNMPNVTFEVHREVCPLNTLGRDKIQFLISTNAGEPPKPVAKIASGGELSRIMLAIKTVLAGRDEVGTLIFDEVDSGVSGSAAQKVGLKLREASRDRQVICVTHLAQIAALADTQYLIEKHVRENRTYTDVAELNYEGRKRELARIMGGEKITPLMLENAAEMLAFAKNSAGS